MPHGQAFVYPSGIWSKGPTREGGLKILSKRANFVVINVLTTVFIGVVTISLFRGVLHFTNLSYGHYRGKSLIYKGSHTLTHEVPPIPQEDRETMMG